MSILLPFLIITLLILINGLFVAAEFAIIGVRPSRLEQLADEGNRTADWLRHVIGDPRQTDRYIATSQLGITLASLGLGMYAEPSIAHLIEEPLHNWFGLEGGIVHTIAFIVALTFITYLHVVIGEMVPKSISLHNAERAVLFLASPMRFAEKLFALPVTVLNNIGLLALRLMRIEMPGHESRLYGPDELELIVSESFAGGLLEDFEQEMVANIFDFTERRVVQVMTPRTSMTALPLSIAEDDLLKLVGESPNSRFPVYENSPENIVGAVHLKDVVRQQLDDQPYDLRALLRQVPFVPETLLVEDLLNSFKKLRLHMAIVIDEFGSVAGLVTLEDLIEEVFGEVHDEFDPDEDEPLVEVEPGHLEAHGTVALDDIEDYVELGDHGYDVETVGGLVMADLGRPPSEGDTINLNGVTLHVDAVDGLSIKRVTLRYDPDHDEAPAHH